MALTNAFNRVARRAKLPTTRIHDLRHTAATFILSAGDNPVAAGKILGHSEESTTT
jgi:integrase